MDLKAQDPFYFSPSISDLSLCGERRWIHKSEKSEEAGSQRRQRRRVGPVEEQAKRSGVRRVPQRKREATDARHRWASTGSGASGRGTQRSFFT